MYRCALQRFIHKLMAALVSYAFAGNFYPTLQLLMTTALFNVRVYGVWINTRNEVLLIDEAIQGKTYTKFPGGGLQFGEGLMDCLRREWREETGMACELIRHYYTTDFFQASAFNAEQQLISVYYLVQGDHEPATITAREPGLRLHWLPLTQLSEDCLHFPIDKKVARRLRQDFLSMLVVAA